MNINYQHISNCISVNATYEKVEELKLIENSFLRILEASFLNHNIKVVTRKPKKYSFGYELNPYYRIKIDKIDILINDVTNCTTNLLLDIVQTEEFKRGLLILVESKDDLIESILSDVFKIKSEKMNLPTKGTITFCEDDGLTLLIYNSSLSIDFFKSLTK